MVSEHAAQHASASPFTTRRSVPTISEAACIVYAPQSEALVGGAAGSAGTAGDDTTGAADGCNGLATGGEFCGAVGGNGDAQGGLEGDTNGGAVGDG